MATRSGAKPANSLHRNFLAKSGVTFAEGVGVKFGASDDEVDLCAAGDQCIGVATAAVVGDGTLRVNVQLLAYATLRVKVGAGGTATRGSWAEQGTAGFTNRTLGGGTTVRYVSGFFLQSGVAADFVELALAPFAGGSS